MRFFEDGDLTVGLKVAQKPYPLELITGEWHIVWAHVDGNQRTTNYDEPGALLAMEMTIRTIEPADKRKKHPNENLQVDMKFCQWGLTYQGHYSTESQASKLTLTQNTTPKVVEADEDAVLVFGAVRDDQDFPFLSFGTSVLPKDTRLKHYQNMEFIAKKTDDFGIYTLELTRNERLRLGFAMDNNGVFDDFTDKAQVKRNKQGETYESLMKQYREHTEARELTLQKLAAVRARMDRELRDVGISGGGAPALTLLSPTTTGAVKRTASGTLKPSPKKANVPNGLGKGRGGRPKSAAGHSSLRSPNAKVARPVPIPANLSNERPLGDNDDDDASIPSLSDEEEDTPPSPSVSSAAPNLSNSSSDTSTPSSRDDTGPRKYKMRDCDLCKSTVTAHNWGVHVNTNKHKINAGITPKSMLSKNTGRGGGAAGRGRIGNGGESSPAETPGRLKRPSSMALRAQGADGAEGPGSA